MNKDFINRFLVPRPPAEPEMVIPGLYHYFSERPDSVARLHLRVEPDGTGMLIVNATAGARLSEAGVFIAKGLLEHQSEPKILKKLEHAFRNAPQSVVLADLERVKRLLSDLAHPKGEFPIDNLEDAALSPYDAQLIAPLEASMQAGPADLVIPLIDRLWEAGIPHVTFILPENPSLEDLAKAVAHAETVGLICGVSGRATDFITGGLLEPLIEAGIDHIHAFYASADPTIHDRYFGEGDHAAAVKLFTQTEALELADVGHVPLVVDTARDLDATLAALQELRVPTVVFYAIATDLAAPLEGPIPGEAMRQLAAQVEEDASEARVRYLWEPPIRYDPDLSLVEQVRRGPRSSGDFSIRVELDGSVIPARGPHQSAGNLLTDPWEQIWGHPRFELYRERLTAPTRCDQCPGLAICAADCPANLRGWAL